MLLPVVFLCNALLLLTVLNSRFRLLAEAIVSGGVVVLSIVLNLLLSPAFNDATGQFGNGMNVLLLLVAAVFLYTNNLAQKLSLSLLMICNYAFLLPVTTTLLKALPFAGDGIWSRRSGLTEIKTVPWHMRFPIPLLPWSERWNYDHYDLT